MYSRRDALTAAAEFVLAVERFADEPPPLVATVGQISALPGAGNVIPGEVTLSLDVRHPQDEMRLSAVSALLAEAEAMAARRGIGLTFTSVLDQPAVPLSAEWRVTLHQLAADLGLSLPELPSGAGHDVMVLAPLVPAALLFVRSPGGLSHHPDEAVLTPDVQAAFELALGVVRRLASPSP